jgi:hypothetical protein
MLAALLCELERPKEGLRVPLLLCAAGLLRPEGWLLGFAWLAYAAPGRSRREVLRWAAVVVAAPLLWAASDLLVTGDALYSLHGTRDLAEQLERPRTFGTAVSAVPSYLREALGDPLVWLGLAGAAGGLVSLYERTVLPAALAGLGILGFLALGVADLPLLIRYLLVPAVMLALFAALLLCGWTVVPRGERAWRWWAAAGLVCLIVLLAFVPRQYRALSSARQTAVTTAAVQDDLRRVADTPTFRAAVARCGRIWVPDPRPRPLLAYWLQRSPRGIAVGGPWHGRRARGLTLVYASEEVARAFTLTFPAVPPAGRAALPAGGCHVAQNASWLVREDC